ncbi:MAG TPA: hypothetical protein VEU30_08795 [Thermoanaerobaculia bacterium]|nr:hypothetical protein [Thermoanaerobaculia bacterium]
MKTSLQRSLAIALLIALAALACNREDKAANTTAATETIAPAQPQPDATGTGDLTQTVDIEGSRSASEGGALNDGTAQPTDTSSTTGTVAPPPTTTSTAPTTTTR